ncbi:probable serine hydrolase [Nilaparvata lugens]|uniref:probable serine hydrolase n=1 Tax=Nilaparvata lugens TaxID=108931 RepID=UPI00193D5D7A|nr:probable serine hydrolase [Nilaparvata lugens]
MKEFDIPVPWGYIAAVSSGNPAGQPILVVHGIQDNAGSFDRLLPLMSSDYFYVCIDLPGHGRSSHYPPGLPLQLLNYVTCVKRVVDHLNWTRFYYIGHSFGAYIGIHFAGAFPEMVEKLVLLDAFYSTITHVTKTAQTFRQCALDFLAHEQRLKKGVPPIYTYDEAVKKITSNRYSILDEESAKILLKRSLVETGTGGYKLSTDQRLKLSLQPYFTTKQQKNFLDRISCPVLTVFANSTYDYSESQRNTHEYLYQNVKNYRFKVVQGQHDVHLQHPERVAPLVNEFLIDRKCKL